MTDSWQGALCAETDPDLFFPEKETHSNQIRQAKRLCATCPLTKECLVEGLLKPYDGIWGGATPKERARLKKYPELIQQHLIELRASARPTKQDN